MEMERTFNPCASGSKPPGSSITDLCPQRLRERILNPSRKHRRFESDQVLQFERSAVFPAKRCTPIEIHVRARGETGRRAVLRGRWETMSVRSRPSAPIAHVPIWRRDRTVDPGRRVRSSSWAPIPGCSLARPKRTPRARETVGSNPAILTNSGV
jgi:hypothetical protein